MLSTSMLDLRAPVYNNDKSISIFSPKSFHIKPLERIELNLRLFFDFVRANGKDDFLYFFELNYLLTLKKGLIVLNHNLNQTKEKEEIKLILYNTNWPEVPNSFTSIFGDRNRVEIQKDEEIGKIYLK